MWWENRNDIREKVNNAIMVIHCPENADNESSTLINTDINADSHGSDCIITETPISISCESNLLFQKSLTFVFFVINLNLQFWGT